jgi:hypothetical protein
MPNPISQRDSFWNKIYEIARQDRRIVIVSADMGAPALDRIRRDLPGQFVNVGIAEQNGILVASGLAREGKRPFFYAIAPFAVFRPVELTRVNQAIMKIPITIVGVGAGFSNETPPRRPPLEDMRCAAFRTSPHSTSDPPWPPGREQSSWPVATTSPRRQVCRRPQRKKLDFKAGFAVLRPRSSADRRTATGHKASRSPTCQGRGPRVA